MKPAGIIFYAALVVGGGLLFGGGFLAGRHWQARIPVHNEAGDFAAYGGSIPYTTSAYWRTNLVLAVKLIETGHGNLECFVVPAGEGGFYMRFRSDTVGQNFPSELQNQLSELARKSMADFTEDRTAAAAALLQSPQN